GFCHKYRQVRKLLRHRTGVIPGSRQRKDARHLISSLRALETRESVGTHSSRIPAATTTPVLALERWSSTTPIPTPQLEQRRFCSTLPARRTQPLELTRSSITTTPRKTRPLERSPCLAIPQATSIRPTVLSRSISTLWVSGTRPRAIARYMAIAP